MIDVPKFGLERRLEFQPGLELRAASEDGGNGTLVGHFAVFDTTTTIRSWWEGTFRERIAPGAFAKTFAERAKLIRCIYEHGYDPTFGSKPIGKPEVLTEDGTGAWHETRLFSAPMIGHHIAEPARDGQLGASFAFDVLGETWDDTPEDGGLPVRTITEVRLYEYGPCPFGAYDDATSGMRAIARSWHQLSTDRRNELHDLFASVASSSRTSPTTPPAGQTTGGTREAATTPPTPPANDHDVTPHIDHQRARQMLALVNSY